MKRFVLGALVVLGALIPVTFVPAQNPAADRLAPVGAGPSPTSPGDLGPRQQVDTVFIRIVADADSVVAIPNSVTVRRGQVVTWSCDLGEWRVNFKSAQPFGDTAVGEGIRGNQGKRNGRGVRANAESGRYKYDIIVQVQGGKNLKADPEVVVDPGDGPG